MKGLFYQAPEQAAGDAAEDYVVAIIGAAGAIFIQHSHIAVREHHHGGISGGALLQGQDIPPGSTLVSTYRQGEPAAGLLFLYI